MCRSCPGGKSANVWEGEEMLESVKRLRDRIAYLRDMKIIVPSEARVLDKCTDEIEREIAENYIALPKDAEGVLIHIGDVMDWCGEKITVAGVSGDAAFWYDEDEGEFMSTLSSELTRFKDPLRTLLEEFATDLANYKHGVDFGMYAERIRELLGVKQ